MLAELSVKNFAIIESLSISLEKGLTVLTGETGAGKSIIIDAIHLLVGGRGSAEFVRYGEDRAEIEGLFLIEDDNHPSYTKAKEFGIDISEGMIVLRRDISKTGKSVCRINGKLVTISILREFGRTLIDIHGQHEHQDLMNQDQHLHMLDQYGGSTIKQALLEYGEVYRKYKSVKQRLTNFNENEQEMAHRLDLIQFQLKEIGKANLQPQEDLELIEEKRKISNYERIYKSLQNSYNALYGDQKGLDWVGLAMNHSEDVVDIDKDLKDIHETISNSFYLLEEISYRIRDHLDQLEYDPARLDFIEGRLNEITQLKRKYGQTVEEILEYAAKIEDEIDTIQNREQHIGNLKEELESVLEDVKLEAENVSKIRKKLAKELINKIGKELKELYMEKAKFDISFLPGGTHQKFTPTGQDDIEFYISTNPGEPLKPLAKIASGGEISRIMLAIKSIFSKHQGVTSIIFDEVDTGVSGRVAQAIAEKIYGISVGSQVLCISHLPQVAAMADTHLFIAKKTVQGRTTSSVTPLDEQEKIKEMCRMISGVEITDLTKEHAKELLKLANDSKLARQL
ncbi:DNA repair protein RecN [Ferdinandcohnia sp. Marseille-Q9671]